MRRKYTRSLLHELTQHNLDYNGQLSSGQAACRRYTPAPHFCGAQLFAAAGKGAE